MKLPRRAFSQMVAGAAALPVVSRIARAQAYPVRPARIIVGVPPGGGSPPSCSSSWRASIWFTCLIVAWRPR